MKNIKKLFISLIVVILTITLVITVITNSQAQTIDSCVESKQGKLYLNHKTRVYNKKGKQYYNIGHGGYIKAVNVNSVDGNWLYVNNATVTTKAWSGKSNGKIPLYNGHGKTLKKTIRSGQKIIVDEKATRPDFEAQVDIDTLPGVRYFYHIKGTNEFITEYDIKGKVRQELPTYSIYSLAYILRDTPYYDKDGKVMRHPGQKGDEIRISKALKMTSSDNNKAELFYKVAAGGGDFIKATSTQ